MNPLNQIIMKKFFLLLMALSGFGIASAQTATKSDTIKSKIEQSKVKMRRLSTVHPSKKQPSPEVAAKNTVGTNSDAKEGQPPKQQPDSGNGKTTPNIPVK